MKRLLFLGSWAILLLTGCSGPQSALDPAGPQAGSIHSLFLIVFGISCFVYVIAVVMALIPTARRGPDGGRRALIASDPAREKRMTMVVGTAVGITALILFGLLFADLFTNRAMASLQAAGTNALTIKLTAHRWWWEVQYTDPTPSNYVTTANEIHLPVGKPVMFHLESHDVIHSFWIPNLHGKKDMIPGHPATNWLRADRAGQFWGQCAEFCGYQHAQMRLSVVTEPESQFKSWLSAQSQDAPQPASDSQKHGQQVFLTGTCVMCHSIAGTAAFASVGPNLTHIASRPRIGAGILPNNRENLAQWVTDAQHVKPGIVMPQNTLPPDDLQALLDYLQSLK